MISLITCTGNRPEAFALCEQYMLRQTYEGEVQWIIVNDCMERGVFPLPKKKKGWIVQLYHGPMKWEPGINTQRPNMDAALQVVLGKKILIIEDDDFDDEDVSESPNFVIKHYKVIFYKVNQIN